MVSQLMPASRTPRLDSLTSLRWWAALGIFGKQHGVAGMMWMVLLRLASITAAWALHVYVESSVEKRMRAWQTGFTESRRAAEQSVDASTAQSREPR